jgi:site-specific DNA recombinase
MQASGVVVYGRVSQDRSEGKSVDDQLAECRAWAQREGWRVIAEHRDDGVSASRYASGKARAEWQACMDLITAGRVDLLVVWEVSRATRDRAVWSALVAACLERGVRIGAGGKVHDPSDPDDGFLLDLQGALAVRESAVTSKRIRRAVRARAAEGRPHGKIPFGYRREHDVTTGKTVAQVPDEATAPMVREIAQRLLGGEALYAVAVDLNSRGLSAPCGGRWDLTQVKRVAISPTNAGLRSHLGEIIGLAKWPALISEADHRMLVAKLTDPARKSWRDGSVKHLLVGIAECGVCGAPCRRVKNRNTPSYACGKGFCVVRSQVHLDEFVTQVVVVRLSQPDVWELFISTEDTEAAEAVEQARILRARLTAFYDQAAEGKLTPTGLVRIERRLLDQIKAAERRAQPRSMPTVLTDIAGPDAVAAWAALSVPQRREVVRALLVPRIMPTGKGTRFFDPGKIEVMWRNA